MGVDTADPERARQQQEHAPWLRMLPPTVVTVAGQTAWVPVHVTDGDPVEVWVELEDGSARRADQVDHWVEPREIDGQPDRRGDVRGADRPAARLPPAQGPQRRHRGAAPT